MLYNIDIMLYYIISYYIILYYILYYKTHQQAECRRGRQYAAKSRKVGAPAQDGAVLKFAYARNLSMEDITI